MHDSNIFLIEAGRTALVDCGTGRFGEEIASEVQKILGKRKLDMILLTHEHYDHVGGANMLIEYFECCCFAHPYTAEVLEKGKNLVTGAPLFGAIQKKVKGIKGLSDGEEIDLGGEVLKVIYSPGHSRGSVTFFQEKEGALFPGDVVFTDGGVGRWDLPGGDGKVLMKSIEMLLELSPTALYPGHGPYSERHGASHVEKGLRSIEMFL